jgi:hypothetical protein
MHLKNLEILRRDLPLPQLLIEMIEAGRWVHPGDDVMLAEVPFIRDPLVFLGTKASMVGCGPLMGPDEVEQGLFSEYRGSMIGERDLPWIDVEKALFIICNRVPGDDVGIALDYRTGINSPRVIGGDWCLGSGCVYRQISPAFDAFVEMLGL